MDLKTAAAFFSKSTLEGWSGSAWVALAGKATIHPYGRSQSEASEFTERRRLMLVSPSVSLGSYTVLRVNGSLIYLLGDRSEDFGLSTYSHVYQVHEAPTTAGVVRATNVTSASGVAGSITTATVATYHADVWYKSAQESAVLDGVYNSEMLIILPSNASLTEQDELALGGVQYSVEDMYYRSGLLICRVARRK